MKAHLKKYLNFRLKQEKLFRRKICDRLIRNYAQLTTFTTCCNVEQTFSQELFDEKLAAVGKFLLKTIRVKKS